MGKWTGIFLGATRFYFMCMLEMKWVSHLHMHGLLCITAHIYTSGLASKYASSDT